MVEGELTMHSICIVNGTSLRSKLRYTEHKPSYANMGNVEAAHTYLSAENTQKTRKKK